MSQLADIMKALEEIALGLEEEECDSIMLQIERIKDEMTTVEKLKRELINHVANADFSDKGGNEDLPPASTFSGFFRLR